MSIWVLLGRAFREFARMFLWLFELWRANKPEFNAAFALARKIVIAVKDKSSGGAVKADYFNKDWDALGDELAEYYTGSKSWRNFFRELAVKELKKRGVI